MGFLMRGHCVARSTHDAGGWVDMSRERVDGEDVRRLFIPWTVFYPIRRGHFVPGVVEV